MSMSGYGHVDVGVDVGADVGVGVGVDVVDDVKRSAYFDADVSQEMPQSLPRELDLLSLSSPLWLLLFPCLFLGSQVQHRINSPR